MTRLGRAFFAAIAALTVGSFASVAWGQEATPTPVETMTPVASPTPAETATAEPTPTPEPTSDPSPTPTPDASPTTMPTPTPTETSDGPTPQGADGTVELDLDPTTTAIEVGKRMRVEAVVFNGTDEDKALTLSIVLPEQLGYVSSDPDGSIVGGGPSPLGEFVGIDLGTVPAGGTVTAEVTFEGLAPTPDGGVPLDFEAAGDGEADVESLVIDVFKDDSPSPGALSLSAEPPSDILGEIGDRLDYSLSVSNASDDSLRDVVIVQRVPGEVHVTAAPLVKGVDAVQVGRFLGREDVVWVIEKLHPNESVPLKWVGVVENPGDLQADASARASARGTRSVKASTTSFLASPGDPAPPINPPFTPIAKRVAIQVEVPTDAALPNGGALLPFTGSGSLGVWTVAGILVLLGGVALYRFGSPRARGKRIPGLLALMCVIAVACVSGNDGEPEASGTPEVQGRRIERGEGGQPTNVDPEGEDDNETEGGEGDTPDGSGQTGSAGSQSGQNPLPGDDEPTDGSATGEQDGTDDGDPPSAPDPAPPTVTETRVVVQEVTLADLPIRSVPSTEGSTGSFTWDEGARRVTSGTSSRTSIDGVPVSVTTTVHDDGGAITVDVSLVNESEAVRVAIEGALVHSVAGGGGTLADLSSGPIDTVLSPGGRVTATFRYLLPSGAYNVDGSFLATG